MKIEERIYGKSELALVYFRFLRSSHSAASIDTLDKKKPRIKHVFIRLPQCQIC